MVYERKNIQAMTAYVPGEQPDQPGVIKLNTNENPYPPSPSVARALESCDVNRLRQYPPPTARPLQQAIAGKHGLLDANVIVTNGGDELLRLAIATFVETSDTIAVARPTYTLYEVLADAHGCRLTAFDLEQNWALPEGYADLLNTAGAKLCFVVNPHAPSGTLIPAGEIARLAEAFNGVLLIDEAYVDFVDPALDYDCTALVRQYDNVLILRTFSKGYSLAGLRMAYGLAAPNLISPMMKTKDSYNTDLISQALAQAAIEDQDYAADTWSKVRQQRALVTAALRRAGYVVPDSQSNFILATVPPGRSAEAIYQALKHQGILVRYFRQDRLDDKLRITIGTEAENGRLLAALATLDQDAPG